jgi:hypothetical protein
LGWRLDRADGGRGRSERPEEFLRRDSGLPQDTPQCTDRNHPMQWDNTAGCALERGLLHDDVTSTLTRPNESQALKRLDRLLSGDPSKFRH